jgi:hypothetical protein
MAENSKTPEGEPKIPDHCLDGPTTIPVANPYTQFSTEPQSGNPTGYSKNSPIIEYDNNGRLPDNHSGVFS